VLSPAELHQEIDGFGGSFLRSGALALARLPSKLQDEVMQHLFSPALGAGLSVGKVPIGACDYCPLTDAANDTTWWGYHETESEAFSLGPDLEAPGGTVPYVRRAQAVMGEGRALWLQATMDYAPAWMLNMSTPLPAANVNQSRYPALAQYYLDYAQHFARHAFPLRYISLFNEPSDSYTAITIPQMAELLVHHVAPLFRKAGPGLPGLTYGSHADRKTTFERLPEALAIAGVSDTMDVVLYHGYDCAPWLCDHGNQTCPQLPAAAALIANLTERYARKKFWMSEVCYAQEYGNWNGPPACPRLPFTAFEDSLQWVRMVIADVRAGASAWIHWNLILDGQGGPHLTSPQHNDPEVDVQQPLVVVAGPHGYALTGVFWALSHFGRLVPRGSRRLASAGGPPNLPHVAFWDPAQARLILVVANDFPRPRRLWLSLPDACLSLELPGISMATLSFALN
jgi:glucosylceramidase